MRTPAPQTQDPFPQPNKGKMSLIFGQNIVRRADSTTKNKKITTKAGMCMDTNKTWTFCHPNRRTFYANRQESSDILH